MGDPYYSVQYYLSTKGPVLESEYPYASADGAYPVPECVDSDLTSESALTDEGFFQVDADFSSVKTHLQYSPLLSGISVQSDFYSYSSGVYEGSYCSTSDPLGHFMVAVGYGSDYIIYRNSWGTDWGESGYVKIRTTYSRCRMFDYVHAPNVGFAYPV